MQIWPKSQAKDIWEILDRWSLLSCWALIFGVLNFLRGTRRLVATFMAATLFISIGFWTRLGHRCLIVASVTRNHRVTLNHRCNAVYESQCTSETGYANRRGLLWWAEQQHASNAEGGPGVADLLQHTFCIVLSLRSRLPWTLWFHSAHGFSKVRPSHSGPGSV